MECMARPLLPEIFNYRRVLKTLILSLPIVFIRIPEEGRMNRYYKSRT